MADDFAEALELALKRLQSSDRYEAQIRATLHKYPAEVVDQVVVRLRERRLLDDGRVARHAVNRNEGARAIGDDALRARLDRRGAEASAIDDALRHAEKSEDDRAAEVLRAKYPVPVHEQRARAARFLYGRGFREESIEAALARWFGDPTDRSDGDVFIE